MITKLSNYLFSKSNVANWRDFSFSILYDISSLGWQSGIHRSSKFFNYWFEEILTSRAEVTAKFLTCSNYPFWVYEVYCCVHMAYFLHLFHWFSYLHLFFNIYKLSFIFIRYTMIIFYIFNQCFNINQKDNEIGRGSCLLQTYKKALWAWECFYFSINQLIN